MAELLLCNAVVELVSRKISTKDTLCKLLHADDLALVVVGAEDPNN